MDNSKFALIFDMDGVIIDSIDFHYMAWRDYLRKWGVELTKSYFMNDMFGTPGREAIRHFINEEHTYESVLQHCDNVDTEFRRIVAAYPVVEPVSGFKKFIDQAKSAGFKTALATSAPFENVKVVFERFGIEKYFDVVVTSNDFIHGKPHPEVYLTALKRLGFKADASVVFEDSLAGITSGRAAGIDVIGVTTSQTSDTLKKAGAFMCINDFSDFKINDLSDIMNRQPRQE